MGAEPPRASAPGERSKHHEGLEMTTLFTANDLKPLVIVRQEVDHGSAEWTEDLGRSQGESLMTLVWDLESRTSWRFIALSSSGALRIEAETLPELVEAINDWYEGEVGYRPSSDDPEMSLGTLLHLVGAVACEGYNS